MKPVTELVLTDPTFSAGQQRSSLDKFWLTLIKDERDLPFVKLTLQISLTLVPLGILLFIPGITGWYWWGIVIAYHIFNNFVFKGPFGLMLHCTSHRPWFKEKYKFLNYYLPWVIGPFFGQTPETYSAHHLAMHHRENNLEEDLSSTMHYQRDSFKGFLQYFAAFFFTVIPTLALYFNDRGQMKLRDRVIRGEAAFWLMCLGLCFISWQATLTVFIIPLFISRIIMMVGNWAQHSFVDAADPGNFYKNSVTCINTKYNYKCWNDGYHISHHISPSLHWTLHPEHLQSNLKDYAANKALVFEGIHFLHIWWYLMTNNYQQLSMHVVNLDGMFASREDAIALMKTRTMKIDKA